jgi:hypothetical protein
VSDARRSVESAINARLDEQRRAAQEVQQEAARKAQEAAAQERHEREARLAYGAVRRPKQAELAGRVRAELSALAKLLADRGVQPERNIPIMGKKKEIHYTGLLAALKRGPFEEVETSGVVGYRKMWVLEETVTHGGGSGWDGEPGPTTTTSGTGLTVNGELVYWLDSDIRIKTEDDSYIALSSIDMEVPSKNEEIVDKWHNKIVAWGTKKLAGTR